MPGLIAALLIACLPGPPRPRSPMMLAASLESPEPRLVPQVSDAGGPLVVAADPSGELALTAGATGLGTLWHLRTGSVVGHVGANLQGATWIGWGAEHALMLDNEHFLYQFKPREGAALRQVADEVCAVALSPAGDLALIGHSSGAVEVMRLGDADEERAGRWTGCPSLGWLDDGLAVVGDQSGALALLSVTGEQGEPEVETRTLDGSRAGVQAIAVGRAGHTLVALGGQVQTMDRRGKLYPGVELPGDATVTGLTLLADNGAAASLVTDGASEVRIWPADLPPGEAPLRIEGGDGVEALAGGGALVRMATGGDPVVLRALEEPVRLSSRDRSEAHLVAGGDRLLMPGSNDSLFLWDLTQGRLLQSWELNPLAALAISAHGRRAAAALGDGALLRWPLDRSPPAQVASLPEGARVAAMAMANDGTLVVGTDQGQVLVVPPSGAAVAPVQLVREGPVRVAISPSGEVALAAADTGLGYALVKTFCPRTGETIETWRVALLKPRAVALSLDGQVGVVGGDTVGDSSEIWRLTAHKAHDIWPAKLSGQVLALALTPGKNDLVVSTTSGQLCEVATDTRTSMCYQGVGDLMVGLALTSSRSNLLIGESASGVARVWRRGAEATWRVALAGSHDMDEQIWAIADSGGRVEASWSGAVDFVHLMPPGSPTAAGARPLDIWEVDPRRYKSGLLRDALTSTPPRYQAYETRAPTLVPLGPVTPEDPTLRVCVIDAGDGMGDPRVRLNGWELSNVVISGDRCVTGGRAGRALTVPLGELRAPAGSNLIEVTVADGQGGARSPTLRVRARPADAAKGGVLVPIAAAEADPRQVETVRAVVIGTSAYKGALGLTWPASDAVGVANGIALGASALKLNVEVTLLDDSKQVSPGATPKEVILRAIGRAAQDTKGSDALVVFMSGHGVTDPSGVWYYLLSNFPEGGAEAVADHADATISSKELSGIFKGTAATRVLLILDTCESGAAADQLAALQSWSAIYVLAATGYGPAYENFKVEHGLLTWSLLDVLSSPSSVPGGLWDIDVVLPLASRRVLELGDQLEMPPLEPPVVTRPRLDRHLIIGKTTSEDFFKALNLRYPVPRVGAPMMLDASALVDTDDLSARVYQQLMSPQPGAEGVEGEAPDGGAGRAFTLAPTGSGGTWRVGGTYQGTPEARTAQARIYEGQIERGEAALTGTDAAVSAGLARWISACVQTGQCDLEAAEARPDDPSGADPLREERAP